MKLSHVFFAYTAIVGLATGAIIVMAPRVMEFWLKPYFWVLIAVAFFDVAVFLKAQGRADAMLSMDARLIGFVIGIVLMVAVPWATGSPARFF